MVADEVQNFGGAPKEHTGVPKEAASLNEALGRFLIRFFPEAGNRKRLRVAGLQIFRKLNVAVACFGPTRLYAHDHNAFAFGRLESSFHKIAKTPFLEDQVIRRKHTEHTFGVELAD